MQKKKNTCDVIGATQKTDVQSKVDLLVHDVKNKKNKKIKKSEVLRLLSVVPAAVAPIPRPGYVSRVEAWTVVK